VEKRRIQKFSVGMQEKEKKTKLQAEVQLTPAREKTLLGPCSFIPVLPELPA